MGRGSGFGKVILFGEHFVVHGVPGIVSAIDLTVDVEVRRIGEGINVRDERKGARGYTERKRTQPQNFGLNSRIFRRCNDQYIIR